MQQDQFQPPSLPQINMSSWAPAFSDDPFQSSSMHHQFDNPFQPSMHHQSDNPFQPSMHHQFDIPFQPSMHHPFNILPFQASMYQFAFDSASLYHQSPNLFHSSSDFPAPPSLSETMARLDRGDSQGPLAPAPSRKRKPKRAAGAVADGCPDAPKKARVAKNPQRQEAARQKLRTEKGKFVAPSLPPLGAQREAELEAQPRLRVRDLAGMSNSVLKTLCQERALSDSGTIRQLVERLARFRLPTHTPVDEEGCARMLDLLARSRLDLLAAGKAAGPVERTGKSELAVLLFDLGVDLSSRPKTERKRKTDRAQPALQPETGGVPVPAAREPLQRQPPTRAQPSCPLQRMELPAHVEELPEHCQLWW